MVSPRLKDDARRKLATSLRTSIERVLTYICISIVVMVTDIQGQDGGNIGCRLLNDEGSVNIPDVFTDLIVHGTS